MDYEIKLTARDQCTLLMNIADQYQRLIEGLHRKRSMRPSERAMTAAQYKRSQTAVLMAIDRLDDEIHRAAGNQAVIDAGRHT